jgi:GAF domain-containing protein
MKTQRGKAKGARRRKRPAAARGRSASQARLKLKVARLSRELKEALEQQTATAEVLGVISSSPGALQPVFEAMLANAVRLCEAKFGVLFLSEGEAFRVVALHGAPPAFAEARRREPLVRPNPGGTLGRVAATKQPVQIADMRAEQAVTNDPGRFAILNLAGARTMLNVPMLKKSELIGQIAIYRQEVRPFTDKQIELLASFAAQAVIAIENARLLNELRQRTDDLGEALEQQTATSEVLKVISSSPGELEPVFQAMLANAVRVCEAKFGVLFRYRDGAFHATASLSVPPAYAEFLRGVSFRPDADPTLANTPLHRLFVSKDIVQSDDESAEANPGPAARYGGARSLIAVPLRKENELIGAFVIYRLEVRPFTDKQVELVTNFAAQAVIAIENTRLLNELRQRTGDLSEALEQQTATSEVLEIISSSQGELDPVFQAILANATRICEAKFGILFRYDNGALYPTATLNAPPALSDFLRQHSPYLPVPGQPLHRLIRTKQVVHTLDQAAEQVQTPSARLAGARSHIAVPMLKENELVGTISVYRQEVRPFTDKQIELVSNFAKQAVIAIENTRLLTELRQRTDDLGEALEQQTATSDVLQVISSSPGELEPVFQSMLANATRICEAKIGILFRYEDGTYTAVAKLGVTPAYAEYLDRGPIRPGATTGLGRVASTRQTIHIVDTHAEQAYADREPFRVATAELGGARSLLNVPMLKEGKLIGAIGIYRQEVRPFTDKQVELVTNFAAQAVIAIENTRLLSELRESLQQQTATSDVLQVISSSPGDVQPVFDAMLEKATRVCEANFGTMFRFEDGTARPVALVGVPQAYVEFVQRGGHQPSEHAPVMRVAKTKQIVHVADFSTEHAYAVERNPFSVAGVEIAGIRTLLVVPMLKDNELIGAIAIYRQEVRLFTDKQIELVKNFAAQAVIAVENARLLNELRQSLQQQTATADVLKIISRSTFDLKSVLNTLVESAVRLCDADFGNIARPADDGFFRVEANYGMSPGLMQLMQRTPIRAGRGSAIGRALQEKATIHILDAQTDPDYRLVEARELGGFHTMLGVPLLREGTPVGVFALARRVVQPFTDKQIELVTTFADQAVIAIENVRLFDEIQDKSRQLAEASQHKSQFLANMSHELRTPLNAILGYTELIRDSVYGEPPDKMRDVLKRIESNGKHLLGLINDVLDLSKIEAGQLTLALADYSLKDVVHGVFSAVEPLAAEKNIAFKVEVAKDLPAGRGDERRITQVLLNLVGNAIKFTDQGEVTIRAAAVDGSYSLSVSDTGPGISEADQAKLFQEFQQADNSITRKKGGTGLGLAISKRIVEMQGGRIWVDSRPGRGSTFFVSLPVEVEQQARAT